MELHTFIAAHQRAHTVCCLSFHDVKPDPSLPHSPLALHLKVKQLLIIASSITTSEVTKW